MLQGYLVLSTELIIPNYPVISPTDAAPQSLYGHIPSPLLIYKKYCWIVHKISYDSSCLIVLRNIKFCWNLLGHFAWFFWSVNVVKKLFIWGWYGTEFLRYHTIPRTRRSNFTSKFKSFVITVLHGAVVRFHCGMTSLPRTQEEWLVAV